MRDCFDRHRSLSALAAAFKRREQRQGVADMFGRLGFEKLVLLDEAATRIAIEHLVMDDPKPTQARQPILPRHSPSLGRNTRSPKQPDQRLRTRHPEFLDSH